jgi:hypothetical protein
MGTSERILIKFGIGGALRDFIEMFNFEVKNLRKIKLLESLSEALPCIYHDTCTAIDIPQGGGGDCRLFCCPKAKQLLQIQKYRLVPFPSLVLVPFLQQYRLAIPRNEGRYSI